MSRIDTATLGRFICGKRPAISIGFDCGGLPINNILQLLLVRQNRVRDSRVKLYGAEY
ncbi:MAG: hypothetical protein K2Y05_01200 [Hyphomicrobiaceae bacterium]|nr:hypothetical protein [Hyphomicrobiaceae bacterium]